MRVMVRTGSVWVVLFRCHNACGLISQNLRITDEKRWNAFLEIVEINHVLNNVTIVFKLTTNIIYKILWGTF